MKVVKYESLTLACILLSICTAHCQESELRMVDQVERPELQSVTSAVVSSDGSCVYTAAFAANAVSTFARDSDTGELTHVQSLTGDDLMGAVCLRLNADETLAAATAFQSKTIVLFKRDPKSGELTQLSAFRRSPKMKEPQLAFPIECLFSSDSKYLFVADSNAIVVLKVTDDGKLEFVERNDGVADCFSDTRGLALRPDTNEFFTASGVGNAISRVSWEPESGKLTVEQVIKDGKDGARGLAGANSVTASKDGKFIYTSSGRFRGDNSVGVFKIDDDGKFQVVQELTEDRDEIGDFEGGNELILSDDQRQLFVAGTTSSTVTIYNRDADTGKLTYLETAMFSPQDNPALGEGQRLGPAGIGVAPDGKHIYVAIEGWSSLAILGVEE